MRRSRELQTALMSVHAHAWWESTGVQPPAFERSSRFAPFSRGHAIDILARQRDAHAADRLEFACRQSYAAPPRSAKPAKYIVEADPIVPTIEDATSISYRVTARVNRRLADLAPVLDPRSWGRCSDFFDPKATYRVKTSAGKPLRDAEGRYLEDTDGPPLGKSWEGLLRESFDGPGVALENVLAIRFNATPKQLCVEYGLYRSERCALGPFLDTGGLVRNTGEVIATEKNGKTTVESTKSLRFDDFTPGDVGEFVDFGDVWGVLLTLAGVASVSDKFILKLACDLG